MSDDRDQDDRVLADPPEPDPAWEAMVRSALDDPLPDDVVERSLALWDLTSIDAELAELLAEESADAELAGVRSAALAVTTFTFVAGETTIELEWDGDALTGQLFPAEAATIDLHQIDLHQQRRVELSVDASSMGTFELTPPRPGTWCLVVRRPAGTVRTPWFTI